MDVAKATRWVVLSGVTHFPCRQVEPRGRISRRSLLESKSGASGVSNLTDWSLIDGSIMTTCLLVRD